MHTNIMHPPNQPITLAKYLGINLEALRKMIKNRQLIEGRFNRYAELNPETVEQLVGIYRSKSESGSGKSEIGSQESESGKAEVRSQNRNSAIHRVAKTEPRTRNNAPHSNAKTESRIRNNAIHRVDKAGSGKPETRTRNNAMNRVDNTIAPTGTVVQVLLLLVALASMYVQMDHTAQVIIADQATVSAYELAKAWMFAFGVQFTGLSMSLFKGNQWYLRGYALADFIINLLYYRPWVENTVELWIQSILLSALLVLTIFSYTQIATGFLKAKKQNNE